MSVKITIYNAQKRPQTPRAYTQKGKMIDPRSVRQRKYSMRGENEFDQ
jgi:hypothetical protein